MPSLRFICGALLAQIALVSVSAIQNNGDNYSCDSPIYCEGPLLKTIQLARIFPDSKTFVDMPTSKSESEVLTAFDQIGGVNATRDQLQQFLNDNFLTAGAELKRLQNISITNPSWLDKIENPDYHGWANQLNEAWANLTFTYDYSDLCEDCVTSTLPVNRPFVVPGGRFREFYYWDTYFVIRGLLLSSQNELAKNMLENFFDLIEKHGFIPNGPRIYYLNRSQPPFLSHMIQEYYDKTGDEDFMSKALPYLDKEYQGWIANTTVQIADPNNRNVKYKLNRYITENTSPRPESYLEDYNTVNNGTDFTDEVKKQMYADIAAGAESGWDYSSRWTRQKAPAPDQKENYEMLRSINTANVIPIDLNSLLWHTESKLAKWYTQFGKQNKSTKKKAVYYSKQAKDRLKAMYNIMWNETDTSFYDFNLTSHSQSIQYTPANVYPIWNGALPDKILKNETITRKLFDETENALKKYKGVLTTSYYYTTMQWDYPNGWPPLSFIAMDAMLRLEQLTKKNITTSSGTSLDRLSRVLGERYAASAYCGWVNTGGSIPGVLEKVNKTVEDNGHMFEKFDVNTIGVSGSQGEYVSQTGFGWTNGIALWVLDTWSNITAPDCTQPVTLNI
ncbi:Trehalase [Choanephora cucurbitarum]|uniref:Trehalase n=1 Tax=Choanephora cucurbitarum TaxID=101091 RepID=A0A1C7NJ22_9FUNG|nr:Trehalase [Choanephora cucurbitarum]